MRAWTVEPFRLLRPATVPTKTVGGSRETKLVGAVAHFILNHEVRKKARFLKCDWQIFRITEPLANYKMVI